MGKSVWSMQSAAIVDASPESVMAWWFSPDRRDEFQSRIEETGARDFSLVVSTADGVRIRTAQWKDRRGWEHHHQVEQHLTSDGLAALSGDRFVAPASDVVSYRSPAGKKVTEMCNGRIEFGPQTGGGTEVSVVHDHTIIGGTWVQRWSMRRATPRNTEKTFKEAIERCRAGAGRSTAQSG